MRRENGIYYGWYIVILAFFGNFISTGTGFYVFNAFMEPLCDQRGWTRTDVNIAPMLGWLAGLFCTVAYGTLVYRVGPRLLMTLGSLLSAISFIALGRVEDIATFYFFFLLLFTGNAAVGGVVANTAVSNWFVKKRGSALGLATAGISLSGVILPYLAMVILEYTDLMHAFQWIGISLLLMVPAAWLVVKNRPEEYNLVPDGMVSDRQGQDRDELAAEGGSPDDSDALILWTPSMLVRVQAFWKLGFAYGLVMMGVVGVMFQLKPRFSDIGFDDTTAMTMMAATAFLGTAGKYIWGMLCDRFEPRRVVAVLMGANAAGLLLSLVTDSIPALILFIIMFGFAMGGVMSTYPVLIADLFGRESFPLVIRFLGLLLGINVLGYLFMGLSFDRAGSYNSAYLIFITLDIIAALLIVSLKRPMISY